MRWLRVDGIDRWVNTEHIHMVYVMRVGAWRSARWCVVVSVGDGEYAWGQNRTGDKMTEEQAKIVAGFIRCLHKLDDGFAQRQAWALDLPAAVIATLVAGLEP